MARITLHNSRYTEHLDETKPDNVVILSDDRDPELMVRADTFYVAEMSLRTIGELIKRFPKDTVVFDAHMGTGVIAVPFWEWMAERIVAQYDRPTTMASLFDGIGGFPLVFSRCGCTPVWASEIEEFPIAVTKVRFPEEE